MALHNRQPTTKIHDGHGRRAAPVCGRVCGGDVAVAVVVDVAVGGTVGDGVQVGVCVDVGDQVGDGVLVGVGLGVELGVTVGIQVGVGVPVGGTTGGVGAGPSGQNTIAKMANTKPPNRKIASRFIVPPAYHWQGGLPLPRQQQRTNGHYLGRSGSRVIVDSSKNAPLAYSNR